MSGEAKRHLVGRILAGIVSLPLGLLALERLTFGVVLAFFAGSSSLEDYVPLLSGLGLVALLAACIKHAFRLQARYWVVFLAFLAVFVVIVVAVQASVFLG